MMLWLLGAACFGPKICPPKSPTSVNVALQDDTVVLGNVHVNVHNGGVGIYACAAKPTPFYGEMMQMRTVPTIYGPRPAPVWVPGMYRSPAIGIARSLPEGDDYMQKCEELAIEACQKSFYGWIRNHAGQIRISPNSPVECIIQKCRYCN